jgi:histidine kinase-, DNA gyrase B-, and HSP90-like ATPase
MWNNKILLYGIDILLSIYAVYLFFYYFDIFFTRKKKKYLYILGVIVFFLWQFGIMTILKLPVYMNIAVTIVITLITVMIIYEGMWWNKCVFVIAFNAIWMMIETLSGYILSTYCNRSTYPQTYEILGSLISKLLFMILIFLLKKVFLNDEIKELSVKYSIMLVLIPIGSIYVMNEIFLFSYKINSGRSDFHSAMAAIILLFINVLIFYIYMKLTDDLRLRRMTSVYEQQLELCERHQEERELSILQLRDVKHNMKNNLVSILAYAENGECKKIIRFVNDIMEEGGMTISAITKSGNIVIDSLISYWYIKAQKQAIDFEVNMNIPMKMPFKGADICLILGNILENAVEAAEKVETKKYIKVGMKYDKDNFLLFVKNNYKGPLIKMKNNRLKSTKSNAENHGVGLSSVYRAVAKYHGTVIIDDSISEQFTIRVVLYGNEE